MGNRDPIKATKMGAKFYSRPLNKKRKIEEFVAANAEFSENNYRKSAVSDSVSVGPIENLGPYKTEKSQRRYSGSQLLKNRLIISVVYRNHPGTMKFTTLATFLLLPLAVVEGQGRPTRGDAAARISDIAAERFADRVADQEAAVSHLLFYCDRPDCIF
jgi:hypothetical protein